MYSWVCVTVKRAAIASLVPPVLALGIQTSGPACDPALAALWTPAHPQLGRYEVCTSPRALTEIADPAWKVEATPPLDAFGDAGSFSRAAVARLYGGRWPAVARGWVEENGRLVSITLVSPYPDRALGALEPGTLIIRYVVFE
jgi:hypothetical protein